MPGTIYKYFTCANSCKGFVNYFESSLNGMEAIYILKGGPGTGKSTLMKTVGEYFWKKGEDVEYIYCSSDTNSLDGLVITGRKAAIVDGTSPHVLEPQAPGAIEEYVNLGDAWTREKLRPHKAEILDIKKKISVLYDKVYASMAEGKAVHDDWEKIYLANTDFQKLDQAALELCGKILGESAADGPGRIIDRFFGACTPDGSVNYIENLTADLKKRYFIKGRPGTGKSTLMKKVATLAKDRGFTTEVYHCSFDPDSLDMVVIRDLSVCLFDATAPHELFPTRDTDETVDLYQAAVNPGTDEAYVFELAGLSEKYNKLNKQACQALGEIHILHDALEKPYIDAVDFTVIEKKTNDLIQEIEAL